MKSPPLGQNCYPSLHFRNLQLHQDLNHRPEQQREQAEPSEESREVATRDLNDTFNASAIAYRN
jgi:hypothetical protein